MRLADVTQGRANNFQLLRFVAATGVIVFHCYALTNRFGDEPLMRLMPQLNFGLLGVETFFAISGFLVTKSWLERAKFAPFALARVLRIYPALTCAILVSIALAAFSISCRCSNPRLRVEERACLEHRIPSARRLRE